MRLGFADRNAPGPQQQVRGDDRNRQYAGQDQHIARAQQQQFQHTRHRRPGRQLGGGLAIGEQRDAAQVQPVVGDYLYRAQDHHHAGRAHEAADHRIGHKAHGPSGVTDAQPTEQQPGRHRDQRHQDKGRAQRMPAGAQIGHQSCHQRRDHGRGGVVGSADGERKGAAPGHDGGPNRRRQEGHRHTGGQERRQGPGENQRREGQAIGRGQYPADRARGHVTQPCANAESRHL